MERVLVSACLLGEPVRHDGRGKAQSHAVLRRWQQEGRVVAACPEVLGGLPVPRPPAEITGDGDGGAVLDGRSRVVSNAGVDVTMAFANGAAMALHIVRQHDIRVAVLKARSPSCGKGAIYDGTFGGRIVAGDGVAAALLQRHGVQVFTEDEFARADAALRRLDDSAAG